METNMRKRMGLAGLFVVAVLGTAVLSAETIYVDPYAPGNNDGSSWEHAYLCLQTALGRAQAGDEIRVAQGTYQPDRRQSFENGVAQPVVASGNREESFILPDGVAMRGGYAGYGTPDPDARDLEAHPSILSGDLLGNDPDLNDLALETLEAFTGDSNRGDNSFTVVVITDTSGQTALDGFTITAGHCEGGQPIDHGLGFIWPFPDPNTHGAGAWVSGRPEVIQCTFWRNSTRAPAQSISGGSAIVNNSSQAIFRECVFRENIAFVEGIGVASGAVLNLRSAPQFFDCTFTNNISASPVSATDSIGPIGGAVANFNSDPEFISCTFTGNSATEGKGGAVFNNITCFPEFTDCTFEENTAFIGGAVYNFRGSYTTFTGCVFLGNVATDSATGSWSLRCKGGAIASDESCVTVVMNCRFLGNKARNMGGSGEGGALYAAGHWILANCLFSGNDAERGAAIYAPYAPGSDGTLASLSVINCTFSSNGSSSSAGAIVGSTRVSIVNSILWNSATYEIGASGGRWHEVEVLYSNVRGGHEGEGNIDADPGFQDPNGPDGIAGTLDDDLRLSLSSPCIDAGSNWYLRYIPDTDLAGGPRVTLDRVDMGAYEFNGPFNYYVDAANGDDTSDGLTRAKAFATIQKGIDTAPDGFTVEVIPGVYTESITFSGKAITVTGSGGAPVLEAQNDYGVSFYMAEGPDSVLKNFIIRNSAMGVFISGSAPTLRNLTVVDNEFGIAAYSGGAPDISNCILWANTAGDLFGCSARYSCIERPSEAAGEGNISEDPLFADRAGGNYHLLSEGGRYVPLYGLWSFDAVTSPCVDAGDPSVDVGLERMPNGWRINMGAFGGTPLASLSLCVPCVAR